jgi:hypothetical protein
VHAFVLRQALLLALPRLQRKAAAILWLLWEALLPELVACALRGWVESWRMPKGGSGCGLSCESYVSPMQGSAKSRNDQAVVRRGRFGGLARLRP